MRHLSILTKILCFAALLIMPCLLCGCPNLMGSGGMDPYGVPNNKGNPGGRSANAR